LTGFAALEVSADVENNKRRRKKPLPKPPKARRRRRRQKLTMPRSVWSPPELTEVMVPLSYCGKAVPSDLGALTKSVLVDLVGTTS
jgi:hypothetical protein